MIGHRYAGGFISSAPNPWNCLSMISVDVWEKLCEFHTGSFTIYLAPQSKNGCEAMDSSPPTIETYIRVSSPQVFQPPAYAAPPSIVRIFPFIHSPSLLAKKQTTLAISSGYPFLVNGEACAAIYLTLATSLHSQCPLATQKERKSSPPAALPRYTSRHLGYSAARHHGTYP